MHVPLYPLTAHTLLIVARGLVGFVCVTAMIYNIAAILFARDFFRRSGRGASPFTPAVTILKPLRGLDPGAYENFASFCRLQFPRYQILFGAESDDDPAIAVARRVAADFPNVDIGIVVNRVAPTANRIDLLPAEMIRKGRFDEVFFVDLPLHDEQIDIFKIHLSRRGVDSTAFDFKQMTQFTNGWTGAEIEQCVISALTQARLADRDVTEQDLISIAAKQVPLSRTMKEQINHIRAWAFERAIRASPPGLAIYRDKYGEVTAS